MSAIRAVRLIQQVSNCDGTAGACWTAGSWAQFQLLVNRDNNLHALIIIIIIFFNIKLTKATMCTIIKQMEQSIYKMQSI